MSRKNKSSKISLINSRLLMTIFLREFFDDITVDSSQELKNSFSDLIDHLGKTGYLQTNGYNFPEIFFDQDVLDEILGYDD